MFERIASTGIVKTEIERNNASIQVFSAVKDYLIGVTHKEDQVDLLLKSPACFGVASSFALSEYIKNTGDAGGTKIDIYAKLNDNNTISFIVKDDGPGFPDSFLKKNPGESMVSYFDKKLKGDDGNEKSRIVSSKTTESKMEAAEASADTVKIKGGQGLGLATVARVLEKTSGTFLVGNFADLPPLIRNNINEEDAAHQSHLESKNDKGHAIHMMTSQPFSPDMAEIFSDRSSITSRYTTYIESIDNDVDKIAAKFMAANLDDNDEEETVTFSMALPKLRFNIPTDLSSTEKDIETTLGAGIIMLDEAQAVSQFHEAEQVQAQHDSPLDRNVTALVTKKDASESPLNKQLGVDTNSPSHDNDSSRDESPRVQLK